jgi:hypothetical protein
MPASVDPNDDNNNDNSFIDIDELLVAIKKENILISM